MIKIIFEKKKKVQEKEIIKERDQRPENNSANQQRLQIQSTAEMKANFL